MKYKWKYEFGEWKSHFDVFDHVINVQKMEARRETLQGIKKKKWL